MLLRLGHISNGKNFFMGLGDPHTDN